MFVKTSIRKCMFIKRKKEWVKNTQAKKFLKKQEKTYGFTCS